MISRSQQLTQYLAATSLGVLLTVALLPTTSAVVRNQILNPQYQARVVDLGMMGPPPPEVARVVAQDPGNYRERLAAARSPDDFWALVHAFPNCPAVYANYLNTVIGDSRYVPIDRPDENAFEFERDRAFTPSAFRTPYAAAPNPAGGSPGPAAVPSDPGAVLAAPEPPPIPAAEAAEAEQAAIAGERLDPGNAYFPAVHAYILFAHYQDAEALAALQRAGRAARWDSYDTEEGLGQLQLLARAFHDSSAGSRIAAVANRRQVPYGVFRELARLANFEATLATRSGHPDQDIAIRHAVIRMGSLMALSHNTVESLVGTAVGAIGAQPSDGWRSPAYRSSPLRRKSGVLYAQFLRRTGHQQEAAWVSAQCAVMNHCRELLTRDTHLPGGLLDLALWNLLPTLWTAGLRLLTSGLGLLMTGGAAVLVLRRGERVRFWWFWLLLLAPLPASALAAWLNQQWLGSGDVQADWVGALLVLAASAVVVVGTAIYALVRRVKLLTGITRGTAAAAVPLGSILVLLYALLVPFTARVDRQLSSRALHLITNETGAAAAHVHETWPTRVPAW